MMPYTLIGSLSIVLPIYALVAYQPCLTTTALPPITVIGGPDGYYSEYTRTYQEFCSEGFTKKTYTITQTCSNIDCKAPALETAPPPGFTKAIVRCSGCGGEGTQVAILTFPSQSIQAYSSHGFIVETLDSAPITNVWLDRVSTAPAVATSRAEHDNNLNAVLGPPTPASPYQTGPMPESSEAQGGGEDHPSRWGIVGTGSSAPKYTGSFTGDSSPNDQHVNNVDGASSTTGLQSGSTATNPAPLEVSSGFMTQNGPSLSSPSSRDSTGPRNKPSDIPSHFNSAPYTAGEPIINSKSSAISDATRPSDTHRVSGDVSDSSGDGSNPPLSPNNTPPGLNQGSKYTGDYIPLQVPDIPPMVSSADSPVANAYACIIINVASVFIMHLV